MLYLNKLKKEKGRTRKWAFELIPFFIIFFIIYYLLVTDYRTTLVPIIGIPSSDYRTTYSDYRTTLICPWINTIQNYRPALHDDLKKQTIRYYKFLLPFQCHTKNNIDYSQKLHFLFVSVA